jgi:hypothetical protein
VEPLAAGDPRQVGGYRLRARLGAGGMGQVFLGYSPAGRAVAVKVIHRQLAADPEFRTRFRREVAAARAVSGAYTAPVTAAGPDDDPPWLATVFVPGPSLAEAVAAAGPFPAVSVWKLAAGLVEALQAVHSCGLVHRDLKPANVLLALDGPRVIDFGISRALEKTAMTTTGLVVGTPSYMSPEQAQGARVGPPSDVFSLGCVIVFAATGRGPFGGGPQASMLYRVVHAEPALGEVPGGLRELAAACLAKAPADRPGLAALVEATAARRAPEEGDALASFWPVPVTGLIRSHQARLTTEMRERTAAPQPEPATTGHTQRGRAGGTVFACGADQVYALRASNGAPLWSSPTGAGGATGIAVAGGVVYAGSNDNRVLALRVSDGKSLWDFPAGGSVQSGIAAADGMVCAGSNDERVFALRASDGKQLWHSPTKGSVTSGIALADGIVYAGGNDYLVRALRASDGRQLLSFTADGPVESTIAVADGIAYFGSEQVYALKGPPT